MLLPRFYFPNGNPTGKLSVDAICKKFSEAFSANKNSCVTTEQLGQVLKVRPLRDIVTLKGDLRKCSMMIAILTVCIHPETLINNLICLCQANNPEHIEI